MNNARSPSHRNSVVKPLGCLNSGGASSPRAAATGGACVHVPLQEKPGDRVDLAWLPPLFTFLLAIMIIVTCNKRKMHKQLILIFLSLFFSNLLLCLLSLFFLDLLHYRSFFRFTSSSPLLQVAGGKKEEWSREGDAAAWLVEGDEEDNGVCGRRCV